MNVDLEQLPLRLLSPWILYSTIQSSTVYKHIIFITIELSIVYILHIYLIP